MCQDEVRYVETAPDEVKAQLAAIRRALMSKPSERIKGMGFEITIWSAIRNEVFGELKVLLRIKRTV
jgi:hypothetical protein